MSTQVTLYWVNRSLDDAKAHESDHTIHSGEQIQNNHNGWYACKRALTRSTRLWEMIIMFLAINNGIVTKK